METTREQLQNMALQCAEQERLMLIKQSEIQIAIQKIQENAVLIDGLIESLDERLCIDASALPKTFGQLILKKPQISIQDAIRQFKTACQTGEIDTVERLLQEPWDKYIDPSMNNNQAIRDACSLGHSEIVFRLLQDPRVDPSEKVLGEKNVIEWASENGHLAIVDLLLQEPWCQRINLQIKIVSSIIASENGHLAVVNRLLQDVRVDPSAYYNEAIETASENGHLAVVDRLLQDPRVNPSDWNNKAIQLASQNGHLAVVERLLQDPRVDPSDGNNYAIRKASENGHREIVELLKRHGCSLGMFSAITQWF